MRTQSGRASGQRRRSLKRSPVCSGVVGEAGSTASNKWGADAESKAWATKPEKCGNGT